MSTRMMMGGALVMLTALMGASPASAQAPEPDVRQVQRWAVRAHGLERSRDRAPSRARIANALPDVEVRATWLDSQDGRTLYREDHALDAQDRWTREAARQDAQDDHERRLMLTLRLRVDLSKLVFDPRELQAARAVEDRARRRAALRLQVADIFYRRRQHQLALAALPAADVTLRRQQALQIELHTARLDALTDGRFSRALRGRSRQGSALRAAR